MIAVVAGAIYILFAVYDSDTALRSRFGDIHAGSIIGVYGTIALVLLAGAIPMGLAAWIGLRWFGRRYRAHRFSDQSIMIDAVFLIFAIEYGLGLKAKGSRLATGTGRGIPGLQDRGDGRAPSAPAVGPSRCSRKAAAPPARVLAGPAKWAALRWLLEAVAARGSRAHDRGSGPRHLDR